MKRKNILFVLALLVSMLIPGIVNAAASNWGVYCGDINKTVSKEDPVRCYLYANIDSSGIYGVLTGVRLNEKLEFVTGDHVGVLDSTINITPYANNTSAGVTNRVCNEPSGCYDFTAPAGQLIQSKAGNNSGDAEIQQFNQDHSEYTIIGWYLVKLTDNATADSCGEFCLNVYPLTTEADKDNYAAVEQGTLSNGLCKEIKPTVVIEEQPKKCTTEGSGENIKYYGKDGQVVTKEQYDKDCNPDTGGWASYAVLAAGAFIALSAITIAKKHNKFYQV